MLTEIELRLLGHQDELSPEHYKFPLTLLLAAKQEIANAIMIDACM